MTWQKWTKITFETSSPILSSWKANYKYEIVNNVLEIYEYFSCLTKAAIKRKYPVPIKINIFYINVLFIAYLL